MGVTRIGGVLVIALVIGLADGRPCFGADDQIIIKPGALRPPGTVTLRTAVRLDPAPKVFVRLTGPGEPRDFPADTTSASRGLVQVALPKDLRQGRYEVALVSESGQALAKGGRLRILATEPPVITKILPHPSYAVDGAYSFELIGEHFGNEAEDNVLRINDMPIAFEAKVSYRGSRPSVSECRGKLPCLLGSRRSLNIHGLSLDRHSLYRPLNVSVEVDSLASAERTLLLSWAQRSTPAIIAFAVLGILAGLVFLIARPKAAQYQPQQRRYSTIAYLFIDPGTNTFSLSLLQLMLWTAAAVVAYVYMAASQSLVQWKWQLPNIPEGLPVLLGLSVGTTALAIGATESRGSKGAGPAHPGLGDFVTTGGVLAPERLQFFLWTVLGVCAFVSATLAQDPATVTEPPKIPENFLPLMGVSALGYLAGKVVRKPGPVIKQLVPSPPYAPTSPPATGVRIVGAHLSPRAQVWLIGELIPSGAVDVVPPESAGAEFVTALVVPPAATAAVFAAVAARQAAASPAPPAAPVAPRAPGVPPTTPAVVGVPTVKVVNPDGQSAEV